MLVTVTVSGGFFPLRLNVICSFKQECLNINCAALFLKPFTRTYLQKETISQDSEMLHKPETLPEHVTCLFSDFGHKHNLWAWLHTARSQSYGQSRHSQKEAEKELKGNKAQSRTIHKQRGCETKETLFNDVFFF